MQNQKITFPSWPTPLANTIKFAAAKGRGSLVAGLMIGAIATPASSAPLENWRFDPATNQLEVTVKPGVQPRYFLMARPARIVLELPNTEVGQLQQQQTYSGSVRQVQVTQLPAGKAQIVLELTRDAVLMREQAKLQRLSTNEAQGDRWVLQPLLAQTTPPSTAESAIPIVVPPPITAQLPSLFPPGADQPTVTAPPAPIAPLTALAPTPPVSLPPVQPATIPPSPVNLRPPTPKPPLAVLPKLPAPVTPPPLPAAKLDFALPAAEDLPPGISLTEDAAIGVSSAPGVLPGTLLGQGNRPAINPAPTIPQPVASVPPPKLSFPVPPKVSSPAPIRVPVPLPAAPADPGALPIAAAPTTPLPPEVIPDQGMVPPVTPPDLPSGIGVVPPSAPAPKLAVVPPTLGAPAASDRSDLPLALTTPVPVTPIQPDIVTAQAPTPTIVSPLAAAGVSGIPAALLQASANPVPAAGSTVSPLPASLPLPTLAANLDIPTELPPATAPNRAPGATVSVPPLSPGPILPDPSVQSLPAVLQSPTLPAQPAATTVVVPPLASEVPAILNQPIGQLPAGQPAPLASSDPIEFGQPLPTGPGLAQPTPLPTGAIALNSTLGNTFLPAGTVLNLQYPGPGPLVLKADQPLQEVLLLKTEIRNQNGAVIVPVGSSVTGRFETGKGGSRFIAQAIAWGGQSVPLVAQSETLSGVRQPSERRLLQNSGLGALAGAIVGGLSGGNVIGGAAAGAAITYATAPKPATIQPGQVLPVRLMEDLK